MTGVVVRTGGGVYRVELDDGATVDAFLRGRLKHRGDLRDRAVVGDRVRISTHDDGTAAVEEVLPRETEIVRRSARSGRPRVLAANVDRLVAVMSVAEPEPRRELLDRFLVLAEAGGLEGIVVVNKLDLLPDGEEGSVVREALEELADVYERAGYRTLFTSARDGRGIDELARALRPGISIVAGPSGVGKSTLLNALDPSLSLRTRPVSRKGGRGRHTTVTAELLRLSTGGRVVDTPGFTAAEPWGIPPGELPRCFPEIRDRQEECRFRGCSHLHEPGCAVRAALEEGGLDEGRYESYVALREELEAPSRPPS